MVCVIAVGVQTTSGDAVARDCEEECEAVLWGDQDGCCGGRDYGNDGTFSCALLLYELNSS